MQMAISTHVDKSDTFDQRVSTAVGRPYAAITLSRSDTRGGHLVLYFEDLDRLGSLIETAATARAELEQAITDTSGAEVS